MRVMLFMAWILLALALLAPLLRRGLTSPTRHPRAGRDELVKDPECQTYVARSRAVRRTDGADVRYFCSAECARRFVARV